jgi:hypothetical protein
VPTKKQRRRQQKNRRHEWEYVYVDEEGHEVEVDAAELRATKKEKAQDEERPRAAGAGAARRTDARGRRVRQIEPPSWRRVFKRAGIFAPIFIVALMLLNPHGSILQAVAQAVPLLVFFIPFSYFTDWLAHRTYQKRLARTETSAARSAAGTKPTPKPKTR